MTKKKKKRQESPSDEREAVERGRAGLEAVDDGEPLVVAFQGQEWTPRVQNDFALVFDIVRLGAENPPRAFAAALAATWRGRNPPKTSFSGCAYNVGRFGGEVLNELRQRGASLTDILAAGGTAYAEITRVYLSEYDVKAAADFSEAPADGP